MSNDRTVKFTLGLNMLNPAHVNINKVLSELDMDIFKSKNQFFIDAATYYIEHFGREALTEPKEKKEPQFISAEEMAVIEERIRQEAREEARQEANKEVMSMVGACWRLCRLTKVQYLSYNSRQIQMIMLTRMMIL